MSLFIKKEIRQKGVKMRDKDFEEFVCEFTDDFDSESSGNFSNQSDSMDSPVANSPLLKSKVFDLRSSISTRLNPPWSRLFKKLAVVHVLTSLITLSLCSQMGVRLFFDGPGLMEAFMVFGFWTCMGLCGAFYIGASFLTLALFVDLDERNKFQRKIPLVVSLLSIVSLGFLLLWGASVSLAVALVWLAGAELAGILGFKLISRVKFPAVA